MHEELREIFGDIKIGLNLLVKSQTYRIWLPKTEGVTDTPPDDWKTTNTEQLEITEGDEIHKKILERNKIHLHQAKDTPFASSKLGKLLKFDGSGPLTEELLTGKADDMGLELVSKQYLEGLTVKTIKTLEKVDVEISIEDYKRFWTKKRESTATSPFGLHIGHYKIACGDDEILEIHRRLLILPFMYCFVPDRWTSTVQCMLEKDPGRPWIHRLRIIELFDAQVNAGFQIYIGRRMMYNAVDEGLLHPSSYGSTPGKTCQEASLHKVLMMDMMRLGKKVGGVLTVMLLDVLIE